MLLLTSIGLSCQDTTNKLRSLNLPSGYKVAIISNAAKGGNNNKYCLLAKKQFNALGYSNVEIKQLKDLKIKDIDILYIAGGDTFKLMNDISKTVGSENIIKFSKNNDKLVIGVSAGSIIFGKSIRSADIILGDPKTYSLENGLRLLDYDVVPHYNPTLDLKIKDYPYSHPLLLISDEQSVLM
jgi:peptidase E